MGFFFKEIFQYAFKKRNLKRLVVFCCKFFSFSSKFISFILPENIQGKIRKQTKKLKKKKTNNAPSQDKCDCIKQLSAVA
jgi:hypothetical protein